MNEYLKKQFVSKWLITTGLITITTIFCALGVILLPILVHKM